jgi:hypothetical protein
VKFSVEGLVVYDPGELLLPTEIDEHGVPYFEIRPCRSCGMLFPLTMGNASPIMSLSSVPTVPPD